MEYIRTTKKLPKTMRLICTSDWHVGSRLFHREACKQLLEEVKQPGTWGVYNGDCLEGKPISSKHFDPAILEDGRMKPGKQAELVADLIRDTKDKWLGWGVGNHDIYLSKDVDLIGSHITGPLGIPKGGYQWVCDLGFCRVFCYHGRHAMPRGAKDPIQRTANQQAWLVNRMAPLRGDCRLMLMGHVHRLLTVGPQHQYTLSAPEDNTGTTRARYFIEPASMITMGGEDEPRPYIPPLSRFYAVTGTLMRNCIEGEISYAEIAGYAPQPIGWIEAHFVNGELDRLEEIVV